MDMSLFDAVESRRTVRDFLPEPVPPEVLDRCLDAARLAASSSNLQPWEFIVLRSPEKRAAAVEACLGQQAARSAPLLIAVVARWDNWRKHRDHILATFRQRGTLRKSQETYYRRIVPLVYTSGPLGILGLLKRGISRALSCLRPMADLRTRSELRVGVHKSTALAAATLMLALRGCFRNRTGRAGSAGQARQGRRGPSGAGLHGPRLTQHRAGRRPSPPGQGQPGAPRRRGA